MQATMQHLVIERAGVLSWRECLRPKLESGLDALVRPLVVGRCDLDVAFMRGLVPIPGGSVLGHECIAEVVDIGDRVRTVMPGQRVLVAAQISCGYCRMCRSGYTGRCEAVPLGASFGMGRAGDFGGALADYVRVPYADAMLVPLPAALNPVEVISIADMALDAWRAVGPNLQQRPGARVLVMGGTATVIGLYAAAISVALGASETVYVDDDAERRGHAERSGARCVAREAEIDGQFDILVDACGDPLMLGRSIARAAPEAVFTSVTIYLSETVPLPLREMYFKGITFRTGRANVRPQMEHVLGLCRGGSFDPNAVPAQVFPFERAEEAWASTALRTAVLRIS
jgi:threonine dehydrogenase-like Zn-dependent dehydrogenase